MSERKRNFYEILNVTSNATLEELKVNYKQLILQYHPDKLQQQQQLENNLQKLEINNEANDKEFVAITEAWNCLKDPVKRKQYDAEELLNKFHTHNNIYAHIKLSEMKKQLNTGDYYLSEEEDDDVDDDDVDGEHSQKVEKEKEKTKYLYTYDCRCGGQYIVDESAEQYCGRADNNQHHDIQIKSNHNNNNGVGDDDDDDADKSTQNNTKNSPNIEENKKNDGDGGGGGGNTADGSVEGVVFVQQHHNEGDEAAAEEVDDEGGELIVECSECSLVIILNG
ncbi:hypothetical protein FF38_01996 [Lucilia cuprina]|uniref:J domain-containing protein n=1 Tax=Lucilia cuprina TaxID=7375 RepID=A0A0L0CLL6_LUCCU|nr:DPH4 like protein [Lucilia cuprina]KNC33258.1 hypothetical protein FF38_01996 [Lucilia cuprina]